MLGTLGHSLPQLANVMGVFVIVQSTFAVLGMRLFGGVAHGDFLTADANFCSFSVAFGVLFRASTGEDWNGIMRDCMVSDKSGGCSEAEGNCGSWLAVPYFVSYIVVTAFVVLNMMIALILHTYAQQKRLEAMAVTPSHEEAFQRAWAPHDPLATGRMPLERVRLVVHDCPPPLGLEPRLHAHGYIKMADVTRYVRRLGLKVYPPLPEEAGPAVLFHDTLSSLLHAAHANEIARTAAAATPRTRRSSSAAVDAVHEIAEQDASRQSRASMRRLSTSRHMKIDAEMALDLASPTELLAACLVQSRWRGWRRNRGDAGVAHRAPPSQDQRTALALSHFSLTAGHRPLSLYAQATPTKPTAPRRDPVLAMAYAAARGVTGGTPLKPSTISAEAAAAAVQEDAARRMAERLRA